MLLCHETLKRYTMKNASPTVVSGCLANVVLLLILGACLLPTAFIAGSVSSASGVAIRTTGRLLCPSGSLPTPHTYATTTTDDYGNTQPSTAYELNCVDSTGQVVKNDPIVYSFLWIGMVTGAAIILVMLLSFLLAAPAGVLIGRVLSRGRSNPPPAVPPI